MKKQKSLHRLFRKIYLYRYLSINNRSSSFSISWIRIKRWRKKSYRRVYFWKRRVKRIYRFKCSRCSIYLEKFTCNLRISIDRSKVNLTLRRLWVRASTRRIWVEIIWITSEKSIKVISMMEWVIIVKIHVVQWNRLQHRTWKPFRTFKPMLINRMFRTITNILIFKGNRQWEISLTLRRVIQWRMRSNRVSRNIV